MNSHHLGILSDYLDQNKHREKRSMVHSIKNKFYIFGLGFACALASSYETEASQNRYARAHNRGHQAATQRGTCARNTGGAVACKACCQKKKMARPNLNVDSCLAKCDHAKNRRQSMRSQGQMRPRRFNWRDQNCCCLVTMRGAYSKRFPTQSGEQGPTWWA